MGVIKFNSEKEKYGCGWLAVSAFFIVGLVSGAPIDGYMIFFGIAFFIGAAYFSINLLDKYKNGEKNAEFEKTVNQILYKDERERNLKLLAKKECSELSSKLGEISQIPNIRLRMKGYYNVRSEVIARRNEPIGRLLEATFNTFTEVDRDLVDAIEAK